MNVYLFGVENNERIMLASQRYFIDTAMDGDGGGVAYKCDRAEWIAEKYFGYRKESLIERLDKLIFPIDPIRGWVENEIERISKKRAWIDEV